MMRLLIFFCAISCSLGLSAQLGIELGAHFNRPSSDFQLPEELSHIGDFEPGPYVALNYWFRLPKQRVEFLPTVYYAQTSNDWGAPNNNIYLKELGAEFKVNVYPFDFNQDCDCPTFGKQGPQLEKGFFLQASGGAAYYATDSDIGFEIASEALDPTISFTYGFGAGLDIGLSNLVTITPNVGARFGTAEYADLIFTDANGMNLDMGAFPKLRTLRAGIQVSIRFDHKRY